MNSKPDVRLVIVRGNHVTEDIKNLNRFLEDGYALREEHDSVNCAEGSVLLYTVWKAAEPTNPLGGKPARKPRKAAKAAPVVAATVTKVPAKRGRKPKVVIAKPVVVAAAAPKKRGRKPKSASAGGNLVKAARKSAGLTQAALAKKLGKTQPAISLAEASNGSVDPAFVEAVLTACELPSGWQPSA